MGDEKDQENKLEEKNRNFVMVFREHMPELRWLNKKSRYGSDIFNFIVEHMDHANALVCSYQVFMDYFDISSETVRRAIKFLKTNGFISVLKTGTSNVYIVNTEIAWTSSEDKKQYCKFQGNVLVSVNENKEYFYRNQIGKITPCVRPNSSKNQNNKKGDDDNGNSSND